MQDIPANRAGHRFFERVSGFFEAPVAHGMDLAGHRIMAEHFPSIIVGHGRISREGAGGIRIFPHVANIDHGFDVVRIPAKGDQLGIIIAAVPGKNFAD